MSPNELLDPSHLALIKDYSLLARTAADGFFAGLHRSLSHGHGTEFFQYRNYSPGEDIKFIDWKVFARSNELYTKTFEEETNTHCYIVLDRSASHDYCGTRSSCSKMDYAKMVAASLSYLAYKQGDSVGLLSYGEGIHDWIQPRSGSMQLNRILRSLSALKAEGETKHEPAWKTLTGRLPGRGIVVFISDMLEAEDELPNLLQFGATSRYDCLAIQVLDPDELDLPFDEARRFVGLEEGKVMPTYPNAIRERYIEDMKMYNAFLKKRLTQVGVDFVQVTTDVSLGYALGRYLHHRERR